MRIASVLPTLEIFGGVRRYLELGNELTARGHEFVLFVEMQNKEEIRCPMWLNCKFDIRHAGWIGDHNTKDFDVAIASEECFSHFRNIKAKKRIYYCISDNVNELSLSISDIVAVNSTRQMNNMKERGISAVDWIGGINIEQFKPGVGRRLLPPQITLQGKWTKYKATGYAIRAIEIAAKKCPLIFTPFAKKEYNNVARCKSDVRKYFAYPGKKIANIYCESTITIAIELSAGWSNVAAESMSCGTPVICGTIGTRDFAIDRETVLIVKEKDVNSISTAIVELLRNKDLYNKLSVNGREKIKEFSWQKVADKIEKTLGEIR